MPARTPTTRWRRALGLCAATAALSMASTGVTFAQTSPAAPVETCNGGKGTLTVAGDEGKQTASLTMTFNGAGNTCTSANGSTGVFTFTPSGSNCVISADVTPGGTLTTPTNTYTVTSGKVTVAQAQNGNDVIVTLTVNLKDSAGKTYTGTGTGTELNTSLAPICLAGTLPTGSFPAPEGSGVVNPT